MGRKPDSFAQQHGYESMNQKSIDWRCQVESFPSDGGAKTLVSLAPLLDLNSNPLLFAERSTNRLQFWTIWTGDTRSHITGDFGVFMDGRVFSGYGLVEAATQWEREVRIW